LRLLLLYRIRRRLFSGSNKKKKPELEKQDVDFTIAMRHCKAAFSAEAEKMQSCGKRFYCAACLKEGAAVTRQRGAGHSSSKLLPRVKSSA
jgi:hypothetical protein